jgi:hypothetical protein
MHSLCIILAFTLSSRLFTQFNASNCNMEQKTPWINKRQTELLQNKDKTQVDQNKADVKNRGQDTLIKTNEDSLSFLSNLESPKSNVDLPILKFQNRHTTRMAKEEIINEFKVGLDGFLELVCGKKYEESDNQAKWEKINGVSYVYYLKTLDFYL